MYRMCHKIRIGETVLPVLTSVKIRKDVSKITDTATIVCPAVAHGRKLAFVSKLAKWQEVVIELGYDDELRTEFKGYVKSVALDDNQVVIDCEDPLFILQRVDLPNMELKNVTLSNLLKRVMGEVNKFRKDNNLGGPLAVDCSYEYTYDKFTFLNATAYSVLVQIQKEGAPNIYMKGDTLRIVPTYMEDEGRAVYSMQRNICKSNLKLKWMKPEDRQLCVIAKSRTKDGKEVEAKAGKDGENKLKIKFKTITSKVDLQTIANNLYNAKVYEGYSGSFSAWLVPFCDANYSVELRDESDVLKNGTYYVNAVDVEFSSSGGVRTLHLGAKVSR